jgi:uncharacterized protein
MKKAKIHSHKPEKKTKKSSKKDVKIIHVHNKKNKKTVKKHTEKKVKKNIKKQIHTHKKILIKKIVKKSKPKIYIIKHQKNVPNQKKASSNNNIKKNKINATDRKKVIVVHGWDGDVNKGWFPWLRANLESQGFEVVMEQMPNTANPNIEEWIPTLKKLSGSVDNNTYFIGHSIGCQTIIRMLENLESEKAGGAIFLAGWFNLKEDTYKENPKKEKQTRKIARPWIDTSIDFSKVQSKFSPGKVTAIFSDDDPYVDISNAEMFKQKLGARILIENGKGHYSELEIDMLPIIVEELMRIAEKERE